MDDGMNGAGSGRPAGVNPVRKSALFPGNGSATRDATPMPRGNGDAAGTKAAGGKTLTPPSGGGK
jgi:hypothetical protein